MRAGVGLTVAGTVGVTELILWCRHIEQLTRSRDALGAAAVGEETVVVDAVETVGQHMDEEATDELVDGESHHLGPVTPAGTVSNSPSSKPPMSAGPMEASDVDCAAKAPQGGFLKCLG